MLDSVLRQKLDQARFVFEEMLERFPLERAMLACSAGKESTLVLYLLVELCRKRGLRPPRVMDIDEKDPIPELVSFRDRLVRDWKLDLLTVRSSSSAGSPIRKSRPHDGLGYGMRKTGARSGAYWLN